SAWLWARARDSSRFGVQSLNLILSSRSRSLRSALYGGAGVETLSDHDFALAFISRLTSRACAIDSVESTSATECQVAACFSQPRGLTPNFFASTAIRILVFISPKPGSFEIRAARSSPSFGSRHTDSATPQLC